MAWSTCSSGLRICAGVPVARLSSLAGASDPWRRLGWSLTGRRASSSRLITAFHSSETVNVKPARISKSVPAAAAGDAEAGSGSLPVDARESELKRLVRRGRRGAGAQPAERHDRTVKKSVGQSKGVGSSVTLSQTISGGRFGIKSKTRRGSTVDPDEQRQIESIRGRTSRSAEVDSSLRQSSREAAVVRIDGAKFKASDSGPAKEATVRKSRKRLSKDVELETSTTRISDKRLQAVPDVLTNLEGKSVSSSGMNSKQNGNHHEGSEAKAKSRQAETQKKPKKKKEFSVEAMLRRDLNMCSKDGDVLRALEIYDKSLAEGTVKWNQYNFNILLYLCSSAALGTMTARQSGSELAEAERLNGQPSPENQNGMGSVESVHETPVEHGKNLGRVDDVITSIVLSPEVMELAARRGFEIFETMKRLEIPPNEATLTAVARLAVAREDGDLAFQMVKEMADLKIAPKLRSYSPAIITFCKSKAVKKAFEVDAHMVAAGVQPEEPELAALLQLCVELGLEKDVYSLLHRLRTRVRALSASTVTTIEEWFSGEMSATAGKHGNQADASAVQQAMQAGGGGWHGLGWLGKGKWKPQWTGIDGEGFCHSCAKQLFTIDLDPEETKNFANSVSELAFSRETKPYEFKRFQEWLERHGPFEAIIDGANVGLYNQNFSQGGFNFYQLNAVANTALDLGLVTKPPLIILHHARTRFGAANSRLGQELIQKWTASNTLYCTPNGSNDDWYWLYAAVKNKCLLITNDEMRDHLFQLLGSDFFPKWKERHQVRLSASSAGLKFRLPPPYSVVIQESEDGSWHFPKMATNNSDSSYEWLCVTREEMSSEKKAPLTSSEDKREDLCQTSQDLSALQPKKHRRVSSQQPAASEPNEANLASGRSKRARSSSPSSPATNVSTKNADKRSPGSPHRQENL